MKVKEIIVEVARMQRSHFIMSTPRMSNLLAKHKQMKEAKKEEPTSKVAAHIIRITNEKEMCARTHSFASSFSQMKSFKNNFIMKMRKTETNSSEFYVLPNRLILQFC